jgi:hypothetical protein
MSFRRFSIILATIAAVLSSSWAAALAWVDRAVSFAFSALASPAAYRPRPTALLLRGPALAYDGPPIHALRHEAGTPQRAAHRNI